MLITVTNQKGGCGKTTLCVHLACWLFDRNKRVAIIDADGQGATHRWLQQAAPGVGVLQAYEPDPIRAAVATLAPHVDVVIADAPPGLDERTRALIELSDLLLVPAGPSMLDMQATFQAVKIAAQIGEHRGRAIDERIILMRRRDGYRQTKVAEAGLTALGFTLTANSISEREVFKLVAEDNTTVTRLAAAPRATAAARLAAQEIDSLFLEVLPHELIAELIPEITVAEHVRAGRTTSKHPDAKGRADRRADLAGEQAA